MEPRLIKNISSKPLQMRFTELGLVSGLSLVAKQAAVAPAQHCRAWR